MTTQDAAARAAFDPLTAEPGQSADLNLEVILDVPVSSAVACVTRLGLGSRDLLAHAPLTIEPGERGS